jgi:hypothetical protein
LVMLRSALTAGLRNVLITFGTVGSPISKAC